ncbi:MAG: flippase-like domain-containing protein [Planctomycetaceae bacterium]|nr:flippase-like domain-containing protein [Planctomycetaceae bacterium]
MSQQPEPVASRPRESCSRSARRRWLGIAIKLIIVGLVLWFIRARIVDWWGQLGQHRFQLDYRWLAVSGGLYLLGSLFCGLFWHRTLRALGQQVGLGRSLRAYYIGHLGKYVPGKAMVVILRAGLIRGPGVEAPLAVVSIFLETLTMMAVGAFLAAAVVVGWVHREQEVWFIAALAMMFAAGLPTLPPIAKWLARILTAGRLNPATNAKLENLGAGTVAIGWILNTVGWAILGLSLWAVLRSLGAGVENPLAELHLCTAAVALATVAGFISLVPGGAVVREAVLAETLVLLLPQTGGIALVASVLLRLVWLLSELAISGILYGVAVIGRRSA